jgi:hypothetical protein
MPAPIVISPNEQNWIKEYLQETYDIVIKDAFDCQKLSNLIEQKNNIKISYSTFRRLFDLVNNSNTSSRFILNQLAISVGFKNWENFKIHIESFDVSVINQNIQLYYHNPEKYYKLLIDTVLNLPIHTWIGGYQFQNIITLILEKYDFEALHEVISYKYDIEEKETYERITIGFQAIYFQAIKGNKQLIEFIKTHISNSIVLQKCLLQAYVNESSLKSFLGDWLEEIEENTLYDLLLFKKLLLCQKAYDENDITKALKLYKHALKYAAVLNFEIHAILKARLGVWDLILNKTSKKLNEYYYNLEKPYDIADFLVISSRLLWLYEKEIPENLFNEVNISIFPPVKNYFEKGRYNMLLLSLAIFYYKKNELADAKYYLKLVNKTAFGYDIANIQFYEKWIDTI